MTSPTSIDRPIYGDHYHSQYCSQELSNVSGNPFPPPLVAVQEDVVHRGADPPLLILGVVGLYAWGTSQPKPQGYAPTATVDSTRYTVDARSKQEWVPFDFNTGEVIDGDFTDTTWDIALQRTKLLTNSGVTNPSVPLAPTTSARSCFETQFRPRRPRSPSTFSGARTTTGRRTR